jgi:ABC-type dipeptide/oligopeptide/nickel transport system permease component
MITGVVLILVFGIGLAWFPSSGHGEVRHLLLPGFSLGFAAAGGIARAMRTGVVEAEQMPHVLAARARGINGNRLTVAHILRVGLSPTVQVVALQVGYLTGGVVVTETLFVRPGLGRLLTSAVLDKDLPVVLGGVLVVVIGYVFANLTSDIFSALLDPRIQYES